MCPTRPAPSIAPTPGIPPPRRAVGGPPVAPLARAALAGLALMLACRAAGLPGGAAGWAAAAALYLAGVAAVARLMRRHYPHDRLGPGNLVTLLRGALVAALLAPLAGGAASGLPVALLGGLALALDGVDGWLARRSGLASDFGARFDVEVDAALALILSLHALAGGGIGAEVLALGVMRYGFVAAGAAWPWLRAPLPPRRSRKAICVVQLAALLVLQLPGLPVEAAVWLTRGAAAALAWSFAVDVLWLAAGRR
ncbi:CDP-alcohol phosphatidyltransferase family protein [Paracoccus spongiarum]|uniref:CDP-alcohol phosphatidyltransferase family protein n=1 Tax=Paracoccus spongiarum TaxID=3064387 RepID=A0ABT9JEH6_9RHOB|nr:CDP-alcohol phosphatidyltransferase family protein [Paracoccus sp. 2205BS29-5]MDP5308197.1 CDP-alcohol phosphatidyltransferase family protein [Paracoccus sp. 2205BS29-5]